jgi:hypothetical protein
VHGEEVQRVLVDLLADRDNVVRMFAAEALQGAGVHEEEAQQVLVDLLADGNAAVRDGAAATLARYLEQEMPEGGSPPEWLQTREPRRAVPTPAPELDEAGEPVPETLTDLLNRALTATGDEKEAATRRLWAALRYAPDLPPPRLDLRTLEELLTALADHPLTHSLAADQEEQTDVRRALVAVFTGRFQELADRRKHSPTAAEQETELVGALPEVLFVEVLDGVLDDLGPPAQDAARTRLLERAFAPDGPEARRTIGLYATLAKGADDETRQKMLRRVFQAGLADDPTVRASALQCLAVFLPRLSGRERSRAFEELLSAASEDPDETVRKEVAWSLRMIYLDLTREEKLALGKKE